jgi:hypothetical protein
VTDGLAVMTACFHEAGHAIAAIRLGLPLSQVVVRDNGCGLTSYEHWLGRAELERWCITTLCGGEGERLVFPGHPSNVGDMRAIDAALEATGVNWSPARLDELRATAGLCAEVGDGMKG